MYTHSKVTSLAQRQSHDRPDISVAALKDMVNTTNGIAAATKQSTMKYCAYFLGNNVHLGGLAQDCNNSSQQWSYCSRALRHGIDSMF